MTKMRTVIRPQRYPEGSFIEHYQGRRLTLLEMTGETKDDACRDRLMTTVHEMEQGILGSYAWSVNDLRIKLEVWTELIADPACILEEHMSFWSQLMMDISNVMDCLAGGDDGMLAELPLLREGEKAA